MAGFCSGGEPSALSKPTPTPQAYSCGDRTTATWRRFPSGMTCAPLTACRGEALLTWCLAASRARTSALPVLAPGLTARSRGCGRRWPASLARFDRASSSWRTPQLSLLEGSVEFLATWPRWGSMRSGECWERGTLAPTTSATGSGLLPTPTTQGNDLCQSMQRWPRHRNLARKLLPTPTAHNAKETGAPSEAQRNAPTLGSIAGGTLNPEWIEWRMGWPIGWTDCAPLETGRFRQWLRLHGACCSVERGHSDDAAVEPGAPSHGVPFRLRARREPTSPWCEGCGDQDDGCEECNGAA